MKAKAYSQLISDQLIKLLVDIPAPTVDPHVPELERRQQQMVRRTAIQTSSISAALSIPGGVTGLITVLPEITAIWRLQSQMISNIAAMNGRSHLITREQMYWCMFRQMGLGLIKEYVIQQGGMYLVRQMSDQAFNQLIKRLSYGLISRQGSRMVGKIIPVVGSVSAGALSYYDTMRVGRNAKRLYSHEIKLLNAGGESNDEETGSLEQDNP